MSKFLWTGTDNESRAKLPELYSGEEKGLEALAQVKFFTPDSSWSWFCSEFDGEDTFYGLVIGFEMELGYFLLSEFEGLKPLIERDLHYEPKTIGYLMQSYDKHGHAF